MNSTEIKERLNARQLCEKRDNIEALVIQALTALGEADSLLKSVNRLGLSFDRNTFFNPSEATYRSRTIDNLMRQVDSKLWNYVLELGQFRELMSADKRQTIDKDMETPPRLTYDTLTATFQDLLHNRINMLQELTESVFKNRNRSFKSNTGHKLNKRLIFSDVFCRHGMRHQSDLLEDACKVFSVLTGTPSPHVINILSDSDEPLLAFDNKVKFVPYNNGNVHVWLLDKELEFKINNILNGCFDGQLPDIAA